MLAAVAAASFATTPLPTTSPAATLTASTTATHVSSSSIATAVTASTISATVVTTACWMCHPVRRHHLRGRQSVLVFIAFAARMQLHRLLQHRKRQPSQRVWSQ